MKLLTIIAFLLYSLAIKANNIAVTNVTLAGQNVSAGVNNSANFTYIEFDLSWNNSWRTASSPTNWDAAWVFVKYRTVGSSTWNHVRLAPSGHNSSGTGTSYSVRVGLENEGSAHNTSTNPAVGAFIYRSANGTGTFSASDIRLKWFYRDNGVGDNDIVDVDVYAIEMVNVPQGSFWLGNNGSNSNSAFYAHPIGSANYQITSESDFQYFTPTATGGSPGITGSLVITGVSGTGPFSMGANFPKGFGSFYCMKYECSQQLYVDFLNSLTTAQQTARQPASTSNKNAWSVSSGTYSTTRPFLPIGYVDAVDFMAFLDWAGLRPMSELEFEKACRGTTTPVTGEHAWGTTNLTSSVSTTNTNEGLATEVSSVAGANAVVRIGAFNTSNGPIRCGAFATSSTTREAAGASFYGIMELSGNQNEVTVFAGVPFNGKFHGNGSLHSGGNADISAWTGFSSGTNNASTGLLIRGGSWENNSWPSLVSSLVSSRVETSTTQYQKVVAGTGIRGVRSESSTTTVETY